MEAETEVNQDGEVTIGDLYSLNQEAYNSVMPYNEEDLEKHLIEVYEWLAERKTPYTMLLCHERRDYTILRHTSNSKKKDVYKDAIMTELRECLQNRGKILDIRYAQDNDAWQIWLRANSENFMFMYFDAEDFIVECD